MTPEETLFEFYSRREGKTFAAMMQRSEVEGHFGFDPGSKEGDFSASTVACGSGVTADDVRKEIHDFKKQDIKFRPPSAILLYGSAYEDLMRSMPVEPVMYSDPGGIRFKVRFEGIPIIRMPQYLYQADTSGSETVPRRVVWRDDSPAAIIPMWQYVVIAVVLALILVLLGGVV